MIISIKNLPWSENRSLVHFYLTLNSLPHLPNFTTVFLLKCVVITALIIYSLCNAYSTILFVVCEMLSLNQLIPDTVKFYYENCQFPRKFFTQSRILPDIQDYMKKRYQYRNVYKCAENAPSLLDTRGNLKLTRGKFLAHAENFMRITRILKWFLSFLKNSRWDKE